MLSVENLKVGYKDNVLLESETFQQNEGVLVALLGRNGTGKSTLLRSLIGIAKPLSGDVKIDNESLFTMKSTRRAELISFVSTATVSAAHLKVWDVVGMGRSLYSSFSGKLAENDKQIVKNCIQKVGMAGFEDVNIDRLSDGERQRVMIARALSQESKMIVLDEPTAFLDLPNRIQVIKLLKDIAKTGKLIILSTHELRLAQELADELWVVKGKKLVRGKTDDQNVESAIECMLNV